MTQKFSVVGRESEFPPTGGRESEFPPTGVGNRSSLLQESGIGVLSYRSRESEFSPTGVGNRSSLLQESVLDWARVLGKVATGRSLLQEDFEN